MGKPIVLSKSLMLALESAKLATEVLIGEAITLTQGKIATAVRSDGYKAYVTIWFVTRTNAGSQKLKVEVPLQRIGTGVVIESGKRTEITFPGCEPFKMVWSNHYVVIMQPQSFGYVTISGSSYKDRKEEAHTN